MRLSDLTGPGDGLNIAVLDYGIGNLRSAQKGLQRLGAVATLTCDPQVIAAADGVVLPGVGNFGACMDALDSTGLTEQAHLVASSGRPFLGICVGMQLMYEASEETPGRAGLGLFPGTVRRLSGDVRIPQMQWNTLQLSQTNGNAHPLMSGLEGAWMYFVHSYAAAEDTHSIATANYGISFAAAVANDNVWATQFHPEKSADAGKLLISNWLSAVRKSLTEGRSS